MELSGGDERLVGTPELAPIGKRIEMLRIERGLSKQQLAKAAGVSRQQLWRVLSGKSELTGSLRERLAFVLQTDVAMLRTDEGVIQREASLVAWLGRGTPATTTAIAGAAGLPATPATTLGDFVNTPGSMESLLATIPRCDAGLALKRALLDAIEDIAMARHIQLPATFFELRRAIITREL